MYRPCEDNVDCNTYRCFLLGLVDHLIFAYFAIEMVYLVNNPQMTFKPIFIFLNLDYQNCGSWVLRRSHLSVGYVEPSGLFHCDVWVRTKEFCRDSQLIPLNYFSVAEYLLAEYLGNINLTALRTIRVLRPLRAVNRIPSMRILGLLNYWF